MDWKGLLACGAMSSKALGRDRCNHSWDSPKLAVEAVTGVELPWCQQPGAYRVKDA